MLNMTYRDAVSILAGHKGPGETQERWLERAAQRAGLTFRTVKGLFYGETSDPPASVERALEMALAQGGLIAKGTRHDLARLAERLDEQEGRLAALERLLRNGAGAPLPAAFEDMPPRGGPVQKRR